MYFYSSSRTRGRWDEASFQRLRLWLSVFHKSPKQPLPYLGPRRNLFLLRCNHSGLQGKRLALKISMWHEAVSLNISGYQNQNSHKPFMRWKVAHRWGTANLGKGSRFDAGYYDLTRTDGQHWSFKLVYVIVMMNLLTLSSSSVPPALKSSRIMEDEAIICEYTISSSLFMFATLEIRNQYGVSTQKPARVLFFPFSP